MTLGLILVINWILGCTGLLIFILKVGPIEIKIKDLPIIILLGVFLLPSILIVATIFFLAAFGNTVIFKK